MFNINICSDLKSWCVSESVTVSKAKTNMSQTLIWCPSLNCLHPPPPSPHQERQRLETILNLCAEYNKGETTSLETLGSARTGFPGVLGDGLGQRPPVDNVLGGTPSSATLRLLQKQRESDEENLKEECSSTESTHQEVRTSPAPSTASALHNGDRQVRGDAHFPTALHATVEAACANEVLGFVTSAALKVSFWGFSVILKRVREF